MIRNRSSQSVPRWNDQPTQNETNDTIQGLAKTVPLSLWYPVVVLILGGCCSNVFTLEVLIGEAPKCAHLITVAQFLVSSADGLLRHLYIPALRRDATSGLSSYLPRLPVPVIPLKRWFGLVAMFFLVSVVNNKALSYDVSMPLHILFRSAGLLVGMGLGWTFFGKRYTNLQVVAVLLITSGVCLAMLNSPKTKESPRITKHDVERGSREMGMFLLSVGMVLSCVLGHWQERTYRVYGRQWREGLFYTHLLGLPFFLFLYRDILEQLEVVNRSALVPLTQLVRPFVPAFLAETMEEVVPVSWTLPRLWFFLAINVFTQYFCISGVHQLTSSTTALTVNLVLNVRKFLSLILSVWYFGNPFGTEMRVGTALVFLGSFLYSTGGTTTKTSTTRKIISQVRKKDR